MTGDHPTFSIRAVNLPEHARNAIHTDEGGRAAGFPGALVAGVTTYAYVTHPIVDAWGLDWVGSGGAEVRFRRPVLAGELLDCIPTPDGSDRLVVEGRVGDDTQPRLVAEAWRVGTSAPPLRPGEALPDRQVRLDGELGADYARRAGDERDPCAGWGIVHPGVWPAVANLVVHQHVARGAWVHTRSIVRHHAAVPVGAEALVRARVVRRFPAHGERAVLDVHVLVDGEVVASLEHEAIVALPGAPTNA